MRFSPGFPKNTKDTCHQDHIAVFCMSDKELERTIVDFIKSPRGQKEKCLYILNNGRQRRIKQRIKIESGAEAQSHEDALDIFEHDEIFGPDDFFDPAGSLGALERTANDALSEGFKNINILCEVLPRTDTECDYDKLKTLERRLKSDFPASDITLLCFYNIAAYEPIKVIRAIQNHPEIIYQNELHGNPYYIPDSSCLKNDGEHYIRSLLDNIVTTDGNGTNDKKNACFSDLDIQILRRRVVENEKTLGIFKESESYFRNLVNAVPVAIIMTDKGGKCLFVNDCWRQLSGLSLQKSIGSGWQRVVHQEDVGRMGVWWYGRNKKQYGPGTLCRINATDGSIKRVELKSSPFYDDNGTMIGYIAMFAEIGVGPDYENDIATDLPTRKKERITSKSRNQNPKFPKY